MYKEILGVLVTNGKIFNKRGPAGSMVTMATAPAKKMVKMIFLILKIK